VLTRLVWCRIALQQLVSCHVAAILTDHNAYIVQSYDVYVCVHVGVHRVVLVCAYAHERTHVMLPEYRAACYVMPRYTHLPGDWRGCQSSLLAAEQLGGLASVCSSAQGRAGCDALPLVMERLQGATQTQRRDNRSRTRNSLTGGRLDVTSATKKLTAHRLRTELFPFQTF